MYSIGNYKIDTSIKKEFKGQLKFIFSGNSNSIFFSDSSESDINKIIPKTIGSEHWISESSDLFRFNKSNGELCSFLLDTPNYNDFGKTDFHIISKEYDFKLKYDFNFGIITPAKYRNFDFKDEKKIICTTKKIDINSNYEIIKFHLDFGFIFEKNKYIGYILYNPLKYIVLDNCNILIRSQPFNSDYNILDLYLNIMSENNLARYDDELEEVIKELDFTITPLLKYSEKTEYTEIIRTTIFQLKDYYL